MEKTDIAATLDRLQLSVSFVFVPWSKSDKAKEKDPSLNYRATVRHGARELFTCDYHMGCGHAPSYHQGRITVDTANAIKRECETGRSNAGRPVTPDTVDFFYNITRDAEAINYATYEEYAADMGLDSDSRMGEAIYRLCLSWGLALRAAIGEEGLTALQNAYGDY